jgi:mono/diheme cytochrome c family protein
MSRDGIATQGSIVFRIALVSLVLIFSLALALALQTGEAQALPEYAAQTGEPCATCHLSPSGGGPRGPRGQAWVGSGKPGNVPTLAESLETLGIHLEANPERYKAPTGQVAPAAPLRAAPAPADAMHKWLNAYDGN